MPTRVIRIRNGDNYTGALGFVHTCEMCQKHACVGYGVDTAKAASELENGNEYAYRHLGRWYCMECDRKLIRS